MSQNCKKDCCQCTIPEAVYWYNVKPRDDVSSATAPANMVYRYCIRLKGINRTSAPTHNQQQAVFKPGDRVWVKTPYGRCTTKYKVGRVTGITSAQNITVNGMPHYVKDLRPIVGPGQPTVCSDIVSENASERFIIIRERPRKQVPSTNAGDASSNNTYNEDLVTLLLRRSTWRKIPPPECFMCDNRIGGSIVVMPRTILPRRNKRSALSATSTWKPEKEKDASGVNCFMEENVISPCEVVRFDEHKRD